MSGRPSVLHVTECYAGGVSRAIDTIVELMPKADHHLLWNGDEVPADDVGYASSVTLPKPLPAAIQRVRDVARRLKPDVVHAHSSWAGVFTRAMPLDVPVIYEPHCYKFDDPGQTAALRGAFRVAERLLAPRSERTVVLSPHEAALARSLHHKGRTHFVPNVASVTPSAAHAATGFESRRDVLMIGRLTKQKDPHFYAEVAEHVRALVDDVRFRWVGDGDAGLRGSLERSGVEVTGWLTDDRLREELARPALYFHSARYEGFPLSILDAAAFEHPIAARRISAFDGLRLPTARTPVTAAALIVEILEGGVQHEAAVSASRELNATMNRDAQREALLALYTSI